MVAPLSPDSIAAWLRVADEKKAPNVWKDPEGWAAWQAFWTACGIHNERATANLMMCEEPARRIWDELSDYFAPRVRYLHALGARRG